MNLTYIVLAAVTVVSNLLSMLLNYQFLTEFSFIWDIWHKCVIISSLLVYYLKEIYEIILHGNPFETNGSFVRFLSQ